MRNRLGSGYATRMTSTATPAREIPAWAGLFTDHAIAALPADVTTATPAQVDEVIRTVQQEMARTSDGLMERLHAALGHQQRSERVGSSSSRHTIERWFDGETEVRGPEAEATARALDPATDSRDYRRHYAGYPQTIGDALAAIDAARAVYAAQLTLFTEMTAEFTRRGGWTRYYRVANTGGHVHNTTACRNTYDTTEWTWPTQLSGATDAEVVEAAGRFTCLTCFPNVREEILADRPIVAERFEVAEQTAERVEREKVATDRKAARIAKGITPDGKPLAVRIPTYRAGHTISVELKTLRAAELRYVEIATAARRESNTLTDRESYGTAAHAILLAIVAKRAATAGVEVTQSFADQVEATFETKIVKRLADRSAYDPR